MLYLHLSKWLESKCRSAAQSVVFLYMVGLGRIGRSRKYISWVGFSKVNLIVWWRLFIKSLMDKSCLKVHMKIRKMSSMNLFQKKVAMMKAFRMVSSCRPMRRLAYGGAALVLMTVPASWKKCLSINERLLFFRIVSSNTPIVWGLGAPGSRVLARNFI